MHQRQGERQIHRAPLLGSAFTNNLKQPVTFSMNMRSELLAMTVLAGVVLSSCSSPLSAQEMVPGVVPLTRLDPRTVAIEIPNGVWMKAGARGEKSVHHPEIKAAEFKAALEAAIIAHGPFSGVEDASELHLTVRLERVRMHPDDGWCFGVESYWTLEDSGTGQVLASVHLDGESKYQGIGRDTSLNGFTRGRNVMSMASQETIKWGLVALETALNSPTGAGE